MADVFRDVIWFARDVLGNRPRIHGNGFLQLDLSDTARLHVWGDPRIPRQCTPTPIHDHMFAFSSLIMRGIMTDIRYTPCVSEEEDGTHWAYKARVREGEDTILVPANTTKPYYMTPISRQTYTPGQSYTMAVGEFHESRPNGLTVTVILKQGKTLSQGGASPTVMVPKGMEPDNRFNRYLMLSEDEMWKIIMDAVRVRL
jgi:hypothetical protein